MYQKLSFYQGWLRHWYGNGSGSSKDWKLWKYLPSLKCGVVCYIFSSSIVGPADAPMWRQEINLWALAHAQSRRAQPRDSSAALLFKPSSGSGVDSVHSRAAKGAGGLPWQLVNFPVIDLGKGLQEWGSTSGLSKRNLLFQNPGQPWSLLCGEVSTGISLHIRHHVIVPSAKINCSWLGGLANTPPWKANRSVQKI